MEMRTMIHRGDSAAMARSNAMPLLKMHRCAVLRPTRRSLRPHAATRNAPAARRAETERAPTPAAPTLPAVSGPALAALAGVLSDLLATPAALAADGVMYNPEGGSETFKSLAGVGYIILVIVYFVRLFKKRADRATSVRIASSSDEVDKEEEEEEEEEEPAAVAEDDVTPVQCLIGFAQAATICYLLYLLSTNVDGYFAKQDLPSQYTARNIAVLIQTVVRGLVYLATFIFGANAVGLAALGVAITVAPEWVKAMEGGPRRKQEERLPDVKITDDIYSLRRAFKEAEEMGRRSAEKEKKREQ